MNDPKTKPHGQSETPPPTSPPSDSPTVTFLTPTQKEKKINELKDKLQEIKKTVDEQRRNSTVLSG